MTSHGWLLGAATLMSFLLAAGCGHEPAAPPVAEEDSSDNSSPTEAPSPTSAESQSTSTPPAPKRSLQQRLGTLFTPRPREILQVPTLREITVPKFPGGYAIWGATGRDDDGKIYFGVSATHVETPSARLFSLIPQTGRVDDLGDVVTRLRDAGVLRDGESQMKIHSKVVEADDGYVYFASMDETGEKEQPLTPPTWGGHLWRMKPGSDRWEHLLSTKEALIAVGGTGRYVYALGYFDHVLHQYDTASGKSKSKAIGSWGAHISRNLLVDLNSHVYVPRVENTADGESVAWLVELDEQLNELQAVPLKHYKATPSFDSHGIVGFAHLLDGSIVFSSSTGFLWHIFPDADGPAKIYAAGWLHPDGESYPASILTYDGREHLCGATKTEEHGYQWFVRSIKWGKTIVASFAGADAKLLDRKGMLLYGTNTRDDQGNAYLAGRYLVGSKRIPVLFELQMPRREGFETD